MKFWSKRYNHHVIGCIMIYELLLPISRNVCLMF